MGEDVLQTLFQLFHRSKMEKFKGIPGPAPSFPLGNARDFMVPTPIGELLANYAKQYGDVVLFWILGQPSLSITDPQLIRQVLLREGCPLHAGNFYKDLPRKALKPVLTETSTFETKDSGEHWQYLNRNHPLNLPFFRRWLEVQLPILQSFLEEWVEKIVQTSAGQPLLAYDTLRRLTFDCFSLATVGKVFEGDEAFEEFLVMCDYGTARMSKSTLASWLIKDEPTDRKYQAVSKSWYGRFQGIVKEAYTHPQGDSLLTMAVREGGSEFNREQMRDICTEVYPGGGISAPSGLSTAVYFMNSTHSFYPILQESLNELWSSSLTLDRLEGCIPLEQVLREALRLWPPVSFFTRNVLPNQPIQLGGYDIPGDTQIFISNFHAHRVTSHWGEGADSFDPSRWNESTRSENDYGSDYFFPFGRGDRACLGRHFALFFMRLTLAVLLHKVSIDFGNQPFSQQYYFTVSAPQKLKAQFVRRDA
jgi:cytochrome P450